MQRWEEKQEKADSYWCLSYSYRSSLWLYVFLSWTS